MNLNTITLLSLLAAVLSAVALLIFDWVYLIFPVITGVVCFLGCLFLIFLRAIGASGRHKGSATEFSQINFDVEKSTHIPASGNNFYECSHSCALANDRRRLLVDFDDTGLLGDVGWGAFAIWS